MLAILIKYHRFFTIPNYLINYFEWVLALANWINFPRLFSNTQSNIIQFKWIYHLLIYEAGSFAQK
jgi:hypothetical protein